jgi:hypothetical protein
MAEYFALLHNFTWREFESAEVARGIHPLAVIVRTEGIPYKTNSGSIYETFDYQFFTEDNVDYLELGTWKIFSSKKAIWYQSTYKLGWSHFKKYKGKWFGFYSTSQSYGIMNEFMIADSRGQIQRIYFESLEELAFNIQIYQSYSTWEELELIIENEKLKHILKENNVEYKLD